MMAAVHLSNVLRLCVSLHSSHRISISNKRMNNPSVTLRFSFDTKGILTVGALFCYSFPDDVDNYDDTRDGDV